jgi:hypothetical protein
MQNGLQSMQMIVLRFMKAFLLLTMFLVGLVACGKGSRPGKEDAAGDEPAHAQSPVHADTLGKAGLSLPDLAADTSLVVFADTAYRLSLRVFDPDATDEEKNNATLTLWHVQNGRATVLLRDSLFCTRPRLALRDFNFDREKDVLVLNTSSARSNWTHHLYLTDGARHRLQRVEGFEEVANPEVDEENKLIISFVVSGKNRYSFYRITPDGKVIDLGHSFEEETGEENDKYEKALRAIKRKHR